MKIFKTIGPITLKGEALFVCSDCGEEHDSQEITQKKWLTLCINQHERFGAGVEGIRQGQKIYATIDAANGEVKLEDADFNELKKAVESAKFSPAVARQVLGFYDEIDNAKEASPK